MTTILVDIDHTLADSAWRDRMIGAPEGWDAYHKAAADDLPLMDTVLLVNGLWSAGFYIIGITARPEKWKKLTTDWLGEHNIEMNDILMRGDEDYRPAPVIKLELARAHFGDRFPEAVAFIIDDREDVCTAFHGAGVSALQIYGRSK